MNNIIARRIASTLNQELVSYAEIINTSNIVHFVSGTIICQVLDSRVIRLYNTPEIELIIQNLEQF